MGQHTSKSSTSSRIICSSPCTIAAILSAHISKTILLPIQRSTVPIKYEPVFTITVRALTADAYQSYQMTSPVPPSTIQPFESFVLLRLPITTAYASGEIIYEITRRYEAFERLFLALKYDQIVHCQHVSHVPTHPSPSSKTFLPEMSIFMTKWLQHLLANSSLAKHSATLTFFTQKDFQLSVQHMQRKYPRNESEEAEEIIDDDGAENVLDDDEGDYVEDDYFQRLENSVDVSVAQVGVELTSPTLVPFGNTPSRSAFASIHQVEQTGSERRVVEVDGDYDILARSVSPVSSLNRNSHAVKLPQGIDILSSADPPEFLLAHEQQGTPKSNVVKSTFNHMEIYTATTVQQSNDDEVNIVSQSVSPSPRCSLLTTALQARYKSPSLSPSYEPKSCTVLHIESISLTGAALNSVSTPRFYLDIPSRFQQNVSLRDFRLLNLIGKGSFGEVLLVRKIDDQRIFAMKVLTKEAIISQNQVEHTKAERNILSSIRHPFIVRLRYAFQSKRRLYLILDFYSGGPLSYHLNKCEKISENHTRFIAAQIICALEHLHSQSIVYRDLKPDNVLLDAHGNAALTDFGLSKQGINDNVSAHSFCGTPEYLAPEIIQQQGHGRAADWWSLGALLYEMLIGHPPYISRSRDRLFQKILSSELRLPSYLSADARHLLMCLLVRDPKDRIGSEHGASEIKIHPFFHGIDWQSLIQKRLTPPFQPVSPWNLNDVAAKEDSHSVNPVSTNQHHARREPSLNSSQLADNSTYVGSILSQLARESEEASVRRSRASISRPLGLEESANHHLANFRDDETETFQDEREDPFYGYSYVNQSPHPFSKASSVPTFT